LYPFLALISAIPIFWIFAFFRNSIEIQRQFKFNIVPFVFLFLVFLVPYKKIIAKVYLPKEEPHEQTAYKFSYYLKEAVNLKRSVNNSYVCYDGHNAHLAFYLVQLNSLGQKISFKDWRDLAKGDVILTNQHHIQDNVENKYLFQLIETYDNVKKYLILGDVVHLKAINGKYISADEGNNLIADRNHASIWERFMINILDGDSCTIQSHKKRYWSVSLNNSGQITAAGETIGPLEIFNIIKLDSSTIALKAANNKYLTVDTKSQRLFAKADSITMNEKFALDPE
jgi:hypothetical protein